MFSNGNVLCFVSCSRNKRESQQKKATYSGLLRSDFQRIGLVKLSIFLWVLQRAKLSYSHSCSCREWGRCTLTSIATRSANINSGFATNKTFSTFLILPTSETSATTFSTISMILVLAASETSNIPCPCDERVFNTLWWVCGQYSVRC